MVTHKLHNSGHNCVATQVVVLPSGWHGKDKLLAALRQALTLSESRKAYYPGTEERLQRLRDAERMRPSWTGSTWTPSCAN